MIVFKDTDYLYASARIRALESSMLKKSDLVKMSHAKSLADAFRMVQDAGIGAAFDERSYEEALSQELQDTYAFVEGLVKCEELIALFRCRYDGHNLKALIKNQKASVDETGLLSPLGNIPADVMKKQYRDGRFEGVSPQLTAAAMEASDILAKTGDPQQVDTRIDKAVLSVMAEGIKKLDNKYLREVIQARIDIFNVRAFIRVKRMRKSPDFLKKILVEGGTIDVGSLMSAYDKSYDELLEVLGPTSLGRYLEPVHESIRDEKSLSEFEKLCDNYFNHIVQNAKRISFGVEPVIAYLLAKENEIKDIRIVLASKGAGVDILQIEERLRDTYE